MLISCLEEVKGLHLNGTSDQKKKAEKAEDILNSIYSVLFALTLAVLCDVYAIYSKMAILLQKVSTLPHIRYDQFRELIEDYREMLEHIDIELCPCSTYRNIQDGDYSISEEHKEEAAQVCSWPFFHKDIATLKDTGKIVHVVQGQLVSDPLRSTRTGSRQRESIKLLDEDKIIKRVEERARDIVTHLSSRLEDKVYREKDVKMIQNTRVILGSQSLMKSVMVRGSPTVSNLIWEKFLSSSTAVDPSLFQRINEEQYRQEFREYVRRLEILSREPAMKECSDMELLEIFLKPENIHLYQDIETVMSVMARAALIISVESVVESWISTMEHHASQRRDLGEMHLHEEMVIAINGPSLVHCDAVVQVYPFINQNPFCIS